MERGFSETLASSTNTYPSGSAMQRFQLATLLASTATTDLSQAGISDRHRSRILQALETLGHSVALLRKNPRISQSSLPTKAAVDEQAYHLRSLGDFYPSLLEAAAMSTYADRLLGTDETGVFGPARGTSVMIGSRQESEVMASGAASTAGGEHNEKASEEGQYYYSKTADAVAAFNVTIIRQKHAEREALMTGGAMRTPRNKSRALNKFRSRKAAIMAMLRLAEAAKKTRLAATAEQGMQEDLEASTKRRQEQEQVAAMQEEDALQDTRTPSSNAVEKPQRRQRADQPEGESSPGGLEGASDEDERKQLGVDVDAAVSEVDDDDAAFSPRKEAQVTNEELLDLILASPASGTAPSGEQSALLKASAANENNVGRRCEDEAVAKRLPPEDVISCEQYVGLLRAAVVEEEASPKTPLLLWLSQLPRLLVGHPTLKGAIDCNATQCVTIQNKWGRILRILSLLGEHDQERAEWRESVLCDSRDSGARGLVNELLDNQTIDPAHPWIQAFFARRLDPAYVVECLFALFLYSVDGRYCDCKTIQECDAKKKSERKTIAEKVAALQSDVSLNDDDRARRLKRFRRQLNHIRSPSQPANQSAFGSNSSLWAVLNWTMRVAFADNTDQATRDLALEMVKFLGPFRERVEEALYHLPKLRRTVFRGIRVPVAKNYKLDTEVVFPPFTSTSLLGREALGFMNSSKPGCFFILHSHSGSMINFASWFPQQAESLLSSFRVFVVKKKMSRTILRLLDRQYDIVTLHEANDHQATDEEIVEALFASAQQTQFVYEGYLLKYIESRVGSQPPPQASTKPLFHALDEFLLTGEHRYLMVLGTGGSGKTSATLAAMSRLATNKDYSYLPIFVPLPSVAGLTDTPGALDEHLLATMGIEERHIPLLRRGGKVTPVVLLDSLDECGALAGQAIQDGLLTSNPISGSLHVIMSSRDEVMGHFTPTASVLVGKDNARGLGQTRIMYVQPFTQNDVKTFVRRNCGDATERVLRSLNLIHVIGRYKLTSHPITLYMIVKLLKIGKIPTAFTRAQLYGAFISLFFLADTKQSQVNAFNLDSTVLLLGKVALVMLKRKQWSMKTKEFLDLLGSNAVDAMSIAQRAPIRVEDLNDPDDDVSWWHKSLGEYLCAYALQHEPAAALTAIGRPFSLDAPSVLSFFADFSLAFTSDAKFNELKTIVKKQTKRRPNHADVSNAVALLAVSKQTLGLDLTGRHIKDCNLYGVQLRDLRQVTFENCVLDNALLDSARVEGASFPNTTCGIPLPPLAGHTGKIRSVAMDNKAAVIVTAASDSTVRVWDGTTGRCKVVLEGHTDVVQAVCVTLDGKYIVSGGYDKVARVWSTESNAVLEELRGHTHSVNAIAITRDGKRVVTGSSDNTARVWDMKTGHQLVRLDRHTDSVLSVDLTDDDSRVISGGLGQFIIIWDINTGADVVPPIRVGASSSHVICLSSDSTKIVSAQGTKVVNMYDVDTGAKVRSFEGTALALCVCMTSDGTTLVAGNHDKTVVLYDVASGETKRKLSGHTDYVNAVCCSGDGRLLVTAGDDGIARIWDVVTDKEIRKSAGHHDVVTSVCLNGDGSRVASASCDGTVRVWHTITGMELRVLRGHNGKVTALAVSRDGSLVTSAGDDLSIRIWEEGSGAQLRSLRGHTEAIRDLAMSDDNTLVMSASNDRTVKLWDWRSTKETCVLAGHTGAVTAVCTDHQGDFIVTGSADKTIRIWDYDGYEQASLTRHRRPVTCLSLSINSSFLVSGSEDKTVRLFDVPNRVELRCFEGHIGSVLSVSLTPDNSLIFSCGEDNALRGWDVESAQELAKLHDGSESVVSLTVSQDGNTLVSADSAIRIWNVNDGSRTVLMRGHSEDITCHWISQDLGTLVTGSEDSTAIVWNTTTGEKLAVMGGHRHEITSVGVFPDGKRVVTGSVDSDVRIWDMKSGVCTAVLKGHTRGVRHVAVNIDGTLVVSVGFDPVMVWDVASGALLRKLDGHTRPVNGAVFHHEHPRRFFTCSDDKTLRFWGADETTEYLKFEVAHPLKRIAICAVDAPKLVAKLFAEMKSGDIVIFGLRRLDVASPKKGKRSDQKKRMEQGQEPWYTMFTFPIPENVIEQRRWVSNRMRLVMRGVDWTENLSKKDMKEGSGANSSLTNTSIMSLVSTSTFAFNPNDASTLMGDTEWDAPLYFLWYTRGHLYIRFPNRENNSNELSFSGNNLKMSPVDRKPSTTTPISLGLPSDANGSLRSPRRRGSAMGELGDSILPDIDVEEWKTTRIIKRQDVLEARDITGKVKRCTNDVAGLVWSIGPEQLQ